MFSATSEPIPMTTPSGKPIGPRHRKIAVLGSRSVGKSSLAVRYVEDYFVESYYPTIETTFSKSIKYKSAEYALEIFDTAGHDEFSILTSKQAHGLHGWVLVYSISSRVTFEMISIIRDKILNHTGLDTIPMVLVANKSDLEPQRVVSIDEGKEMAEKFKCGFVECSARQGDNVAKVFEGAIAEIEKSLNPETAQPNQSVCTIS